MPQLLNISATPEIEQAVKELVSEVLPSLNTASWSEHLQAQGLNPSTLAQLYVESLYNMKPSQKAKEIRDLLVSLGVTKSTEPATAAPSIIINGEKIQLQAFILPDRS